MRMYMYIFEKPCLCVERHWNYHCSSMSSADSAFDQFSVINRLQSKVPINQSKSAHQVSNVSVRFSEQSLVGFTNLGHLSYIKDETTKSS